MGCSLRLDYYNEDESDKLVDCFLDLGLFFIEFKVDDKIRCLS